jgi:hypothetical protein
VSTIQELLVGALRKSGHAVAILDRELKICWEGGMPRAIIGAPVNILWQGAKMARREAMKVLSCLASGNACQTTGQGKKGGERWRIDFIPLYDSTGELQGFAAVRQCVSSVTHEFSDGLAEMYELLFEMGGITGLRVA